MEVILKQDIKNLGYADEVVKVKNGYGLNYLIPRGFAVIASEANMKVHAETMKQRAHKMAKIKGDAEKLADAISSVTLTINAKVGENGKLYGSVTSQNIADTLKKWDIPLTRSKSQCLKNTFVKPALTLLKLHCTATLKLK